MSKKRIFLMAGIVVCLIALALIVWVIAKPDDKCGYYTKCVEEEKTQVNNPPEIVTPSKNGVVDPNSKSRPVAVMINNIAVARPYQSGLQDAYLVYEMVVEGGITRMLAVFKDADTARIGSVRSSRHYYLDYALENDAIYVHYGWSSYAKSDISSLKINNINGLYDNAFWRDKDLNVSSEHTAFTSMEKINNVVKSKGYRTTSDKKLLLTYNDEDFDYSTIDGSKKADVVSIKYSNYSTTSYVYDPEVKVYKRLVNDKNHVDYVTKEQFTAKNIITYQVSNNTIAGDEKGRQNFDNIGSGTGYYISNGIAVPIKWEKISRESQTKYTYLDGTELKVNYGNTYIQIQPKGQSLIIE